MYTMSTPSGTLRLDGVIIEQNDQLQPYRDYVAWLREGNGPVQIADQEEPEPRQHITVTALQMRKALIERGQHEQVKAIVYGSNDELIIASWEYASEFESDHPLLLNMLPAMGMDKAAMYEIFELAKTL